ncbi:MAG TPA: hypothetical protein VFI88_02440 [Sphingomicrobium sp.]|jgi:hypothetical protein|nr:hypothetical protein [Sphingomicrobium sp.]
MSAGSPDRRPVEVGVMIAASGDGKQLRDFASRLTGDVDEPLEQASGRDWRFQRGELVTLDSDEKRRGADFVSEASLRLAEGSYDVMLVITDATLVSRQERIIAGLTSPLTRICVMSTRQLRKPGRGPDLPLDDEKVRWNAAALALNLIGRVLGADTRAKSKGAMAPFRMDPERARAEAFDKADRIETLADRFIEPEYRTPGPIGELWAHLRAAVTQPLMIFKALVHNRAPFLALRLPGFAAAALAPVFLLVFTAEIWDAGLGMSPTTAWSYAAISIAAATLYLSFVQRLFLPRKDGPAIPKHLAVANDVIFTTIFLGVIGLFAMLILFSLALEILVFPQGLISTWPTLQDPEVNFYDKLRLAAFISTVGITTGALAGGLQRQDVLRQLALFETAA